VAPTTFKHVFEDLPLLPIDLKFLEVGNSLYITHGALHRMGSRDSSLADEGLGRRKADELQNEVPRACHITAIAMKAKLVLFRSRVKELIELLLLFPGWQEGTSASRSHRNVRRHETNSKSMPCSRDL
jgi:hypothetical protein